MRLKVKVQPNAKKTEVVELTVDSLKVKLQAPAIEGKANGALIDYLSELFNCPKRDLKIISGLNSRNKVLEIQGIEELPQHLLWNSQLTFPLQP